MLAVCWKRNWSLCPQHFAFFRAPRKHWYCGYGLLFSSVSCDAPPEITVTRQIWLMKQNEDSRLENLERGHTRKSLEQAEQVKYFMEYYQGTRPVSWLNERTNAAWCMLGYLIKAFLFLFFFLVTTDIERKMLNKRMFPNSFAIWNWFYEVEILLTY